MVTFVLAGHETTATALTWSLYLLAQHPHIQERAAAEHDATEYPDLSSSPFTSAVFQEALRLYPPVPLYGRRGLEDTTLDGYMVPRGATVLLSPYITHRSETSFQRPDEFDPNRWLEQPAPPRFAFFPFGGGAKMCIGDTFAKTEGIVILSTLLRHFRFRLTDQVPVEVDPGVTLKPGKPILLELELRNASTSECMTSASACIPVPLPATAGRHTE